jgi:anti-sigma-K factor RskA
MNELFQPDKEDQIETLTGAYALDAVTPDERAALEEAMAGSEALRTEVVELTDTAVELGLAVPPVTPSVELRSAVLAAIATAPQLPAPRREVRRRAPGPAETRAMGRWTRVSILLTSAAAVVALIAGGIAVTHFTNPITMLSSAQDSQHVTKPVDGGGTATVLWSNSLGEAAVTVAGIGQLPRGFVYQLWYMGDEIRPAGTFAADGTVVLAGQMRAGDTIGISIEPTGGSPQPTSDPILAVETS